MAPPALPLNRDALQKVFRRLTRVTPREPKITIGLDLGSTAIKLVALGPRRSVARSRAIIAQHLVQVPEDGQGGDMSSAVKAAVDTLRVSARTVNLSVSGPWVIMRVIELPTMSPSEMRQALPFEAQRYLPFNLQDVVLDGVSLGPAGSGKTWVLIVACKKELLDRRLDWLKRGGLEVAVVDVDALALANSYLENRNGGQNDQALAIINVGGQLTNLVVFRGELPYLVRDIPWGSEKLSRQIGEQLSVKPSDVLQALVKNQVPAEWRPSLQTACETLATELQLSFDYFENRFGQPPQQVLVSGGLSQSAELVEALKAHFTQPLTPWTPVSGLSGQFAVAYGLALRTE